MQDATKRARVDDAAFERDLLALPKAELHIHLEGAMRPSTLTELCAKYGIVRPPDTRGQQFPDFGPFATCYIAVCECLRHEDDIFRLVREVAEDAAACGALWIEPALSILLYAHRFGGVEATLELLLRAAAIAETSTGVGLGYVVAAERHLPPAEASNLARNVRNVIDGGKGMIHDRLGIVGFGLHSAESGNPPEPFAEAFKIACVGGVVAIPHAGEIPPSPGTGPASVQFCVDCIGARRIEHGVLAAEDPALVEHLADLGACLDVCPTSNYLLRVCTSLSEHPLPSLIRAGVTCTINSDDPLLFGCNLLGEYELCRSDMGLTDAELAACARASFRHSRAPEDVKQRGLIGVEAWLNAKDSKSHVPSPQKLHDLVKIDSCGSVVGA